MTTKITVQAHVGSQFSQVTVPIPTLKYLDNFIRMNKSAEDLLALGVFPNAKEITESFAAHHAVMHKLGCSIEMLNRLNPLIVVVGDGSTPRTGATFAFKSPFEVISIDPNLNWIGARNTVNRLFCVRSTLKEYCNIFSDPHDIPIVSGVRPIILVNVHGHVPAAELKRFHELVGDRLFAVVEIPCCYPQYSIDAFGEPTMEYIDWGIHSEKRSVRIWKFKKEKKPTHLKLRKSSCTDKTLTRNRIPCILGYPYRQRWYWQMAKRRRFVSESSGRLKTNEPPSVVAS